jgi:type I restriction enzyme, S subunit
MKRQVILMVKTKLGDVAREYKESRKGDKSGFPIVGLEHIIPEEVILTQWDEEKETSFTKVFRKGQILFGRRRAYLKKAAVAPFDGICSGDITVIEAIPGKVLPELLPFIIQNNNLFDFAVGKSAGSLSPRVKWEHLKNYEFELPSLDEQKKLAETLWIIEEEKKAVKRAVEAGRALLTSLANSITDESTDEDMVELYTCCTYVRGLTYSRKDESPVPTEYKVFRANNIDKSSFELVLDDVKYVTGVKNDNSRLRPNDIMVCSANGSKDHIGKFTIIRGEVDAYFGGFMGVLRCNEAVLLPEFLFYLLHGRRYADYISKRITGTNIINLKGSDFLEFMIVIPDLDEQHKFITICKLIDNEIVALNDKFFALNRIRSKLF